MNAKYCNFGHAVIIKKEKFQLKNYNVYCGMWKIYEFIVNV